MLSLSQSLRHFFKPRVLSAHYFVANTDRIRLYVARSPTSESDSQAKKRDKIPGSTRSIRRRARIDDLARDSERERARRRQRAVFIANYVNERSSDEDQPAGSEDARPRDLGRSWGFSQPRRWDRSDVDQMRRLENRVRDQAAYELELMARSNRDSLDAVLPQNDGDAGSGGEERRRLVCRF